MFAKLAKFLPSPSAPPCCSHLSQKSSLIAALHYYRQWTQKMGKRFCEIFAKNSQHFQKFWEVFESFQTIRMRSDAFGCVLILSDAWWRQKNAEKAKRKFSKIMCIFAMFSRSYVKIELATPHSMNRTKAKTNEVVLK